MDEAATPKIYLAFAAVFVTVLAWASAFPLIRIALGGLSPLPLAAARFWLAASIAAIWLLAVRPAVPNRRDVAVFLLCGLAGIAFYNACLNTGQKTVSPGAASFLVNTGPIITALLATLFLRERFGRIAWIGSAVALAGVAVIARGQPGGLHLGAGASLVVMAAACQATYFTLQRPLVPRYGALASTAYTFIAGALLLTPWLPKAVVSLAAAGPSSPTAYALVALVLLPSIIGYAAWTYALGILGAARAANFLYLVPPVATGISYLLTGEIPGWSTLVGGLVAITGVAIVNLRSKLIGKVRLPKCITEWGLDRAAGTWGGYQAAAPRDNRACPAAD
jgi:drug/metabolite transporter (DMT)-like permease